MKKIHTQVCDKVDETTPEEEKQGKKALWGTIMEVQEKKTKS